MRAQGNSRSGGRILVDQLQLQGVERLTCVPGESFLAVLDALHDASIDVLVCRQEAGASIMAEAYGKLTGRPGVCFVTRGPGATNGAHGVHIAAQDSTPMIMFVGQVERGMLGARGVSGAGLQGGVRLDRQMGGGDRQRRAHPGAGRARLPRRDAGQAGAGGGVAAGRHPDRDGGRRRRAAGGACGHCAGRGRHEGAGRPGEGGEEAVHDRRRLALECGRRQIGRRLCRARRYSGRGLVPAGAAVSRRSSELCRRPRHRSQPKTRRAHQGGGPSAPGRRAHVGSPVVRLHADRRADAEAEAGARASRRRRARPRLSADAGHSGEPDRVCIKTCGARCRWARQCGGGGHRACGLPRLVRQSRESFPAVSSSAR